MISVVHQDIRISFVCDLPAVVPSESRPSRTISRLSRSMTAFSTCIRADSKDSYTEL